MNIYVYKNLFEVYILYIYFIKKNQKNLISANLLKDGDAKL